MKNEILVVGMFVTHTTCTQKNVYDIICLWAFTFITQSPMNFNTIYDGVTEVSIRVDIYDNEF